MGYVNKGLQPLDGKALVQWVIERLAPQVDSLFINANRDAANYGEFGYPVIADLIPDFAGPLAGIHRALQHVPHSLLATAPCDSPYLPTDLVSRLHQALQRHAAQIAIARSGGHIHPVFSLIRTAALPSLTRFLADGGRAIKHWHATLDSCVVDFDDEATAFDNINTLDELQRISPSAPTIAV